jgi:hypothetical protein
VGFAHLPPEFEEVGKAHPTRGKAKRGRDQTNPISPLPALAIDGRARYRAIRNVDGPKGRDGAMIRPKNGFLRWVIPAILLAPTARSLAFDEKPDALTMTKPVLCLKVHGFASFEPLPAATLTADDKMMVYYEPSGYKIERTKDGYRASFAQDGRIRKKGSKDPIWKKEKMIEYEPKSMTPPYRIFMRSDLSIKGLPPGDYELDLVLHDQLAKDASATRTVAFKVVPAPDDVEVKREETPKKKP